MEAEGCYGEGRQAHVTAVRLRISGCRSRSMVHSDTRINSPLLTLLAALARVALAVTPPSIAAEKGVLLVAVHSSTHIWQGQGQARKGARVVVMVELARGKKPKKQGAAASIIARTRHFEVARGRGSTRGPKASRPISRVSSSCSSPSHNR